MTPQLSFSEAFVQEQVINYLKQYYESRSSNGIVYAGSEAFTQNKAFRADGLIVFHQRPSKIVTASLEVKRDLGKGDLNKSIDYGRARTTAYIVSSLIGLLASILLFKLWRPLLLEPLWYIAHVLTTVTLGYIFYQILKQKKLFFTQRIRALQQLANYPANERWLAFAYDSRIHSRDKLKQVILACRQEGAGLIVMRPDKGWRIEKEVEPRYNNSPGKQILKKYLEESSIAQHIQSKKHRPIWWFRKTPAQRKYYSKIMLSVTLVFLVFVFVLGAQKESRSHQPKVANPEIVPTEPPQNAPTPEGNSGEPAPTPPAITADTTCNLPTQGYLIIEGQFQSAAEASQRATDFESLRLAECRPLWLPCTGAEASIWTVQIGSPVHDQSEARRQLDYHVKNLSRAGAYRQSPKIIPLH
ncbi:hypothetical protein [Phaeodactylibacter xiamenensis]|uniref:hypothetical protein n=1 Tax=Phaeodactylibacter xiamenensis TaxID=1524460 RepID=UPI003BAB43BB